MKKILLSLATCAVAFGASAEKALIICDGAQPIYSGELPAATVVVPIGFDAKNDGKTLVCNAGQLKWTDPSSFACRNGHIRWAAKEAIFTPTSGVTITKITTHTATTANMGSFGADWVVDGLFSTYTPTDGTAPVTMKPAAQNRVNWIEIEYTGTPTQVLPAIATSFDLAQPGKLTFASATEGAKIYYTTDGTDPTVESTEAVNGVVEFTGDVVIKTIAVKDGMTNSFVYQQPAMACAEGSKIAPFYFPQPSKVYYLKDNVPTQFNKDLLVEAADGNKSWDTGYCLSNIDIPTVEFVSENTKISIVGGNTTPPRYFCSATFGYNYELRAYAYSYLTFTAPDGYVITDVIFNSADTQDAANTVLGYSEIVNNANTFADVTLPGTLNQFNKYSKWNWHYVAPKDGVKDIKILDKKGTQYLDNFFVCFAPENGAGVAEMTIDENAPVEYFNLQGVKVANPENGIFIRRQGTKVEKIMVK